MLTLLFALFLVLFALSQTHPEKLPTLAGAMRQERAPLKASGKETASPAPTPQRIESVVVSDILSPTPTPGPVEVSPTPAPPVEPPKPKVTPEQLSQQLRSQLGDALGGLGEVRIEERGVVVALLDTPFLFESGQTRIGKRGTELLTSVCKIVKLQNLPVRVEGHTDNVPIHNSIYASNWELSVTRAAAVARLLSELGVNPDHLSAMGYGDTRPRHPNTSDKDRAKNRRVEIVFMCGH